MIVFSWIMMNVAIVMLFDNFNIYPGTNNAEVLNFLLIRELLYYLC